MHKLINSLQHYAWGSKTALTRLYHIANPDNQPMAELWMGAHPKSPSCIAIDGQRRSLREVIAENPVAMLGQAVADRFGELPFLFKVLSARQPLSVQVHPGKSAAEAGFARENAAGIPVDAAERNYKDANHKPELVFALTPFKAINGFREISDMVSLLQPIAGAHHAIAHFLRCADETHLPRLFSSLLTMESETKSRALGILKAALDSQQGEPWSTIRAIATDYPEDNGLFSLLLMNVITLQPGEAMFLFAETPHAYLNGVALEVMANSDNVLRAGLTPKYIDIPELLANIRFTPKPFDTLRIQPRQQGDALLFPVPVEDFAFSLHTLRVTPVAVSQSGAAILFCVEGQAIIRHGNEQLTLDPGESCFIAAREASVILSGTGRVARVCNQLDQTDPEGDFRHRLL